MSVHGFGSEQWDRLKQERGSERRNACPQGDAMTELDLEAIERWLCVGVKTTQDRQMLDLTAEVRRLRSRLALAEKLIGLEWIGEFKHCVECHSFEKQFSRPVLESLIGHKAGCLRGEWFGSASLSPQLKLQGTP